MYNFRNVLVVSLIFAFLQSACGNKEIKEKTESLKNIAIPIRSIDPKDEDYSDLQFLKKIIERDSLQVILLGEANHGDGTTFLAKSRIIKFLHKEAGFDVLAFESGLFDCNNSWEESKISGKYSEEIRNSVFGMWVNSNECIELVNYMQSTLSTSRPLELSGFDSQLTAYESCHLLIERLYKNNLDFLTQAEKNLFVKIVCLEEEIKSGKDRTYNNNLIDKVITSLDSLSKNDSKYEFWKLVIEGVKLNYNGYLAMKYNQGVDYTDPELINARDKQMGKNLVWLLKNKYKNRKVIIWAASFHNSRNLSQLLSKENDSTYINNLYKKTVTMGDIVYNAIGKKMYSIVFTGYKGGYRKLENSDYTELNKPSKESLEDILENTGIDISFIDLRNSGNPGWLKQKFKMRPLGFNEIEGIWTNITDGIFFIYEVKPSTFGNEY